MRSRLITCSRCFPTLHYGPGDVRLAHGPDEAVEVDEVLRVVETLVLTALRTCGTLD